MRERHDVADREPEDRGGQDLGRRELQRHPDRDSRELRVEEVAGVCGGDRRGGFAELREDEWGTEPNDLLPSARRLRPELDELFALVRGAGGTPQLTGSGPTIFTMADDEEHASAIAGALGQSGARTTLTRPREAPAAIELTDEEEA